MSKSYLERILGALIKDAGIAPPILEFRFCDDRKWRADMVWCVDGRKVMLEVMGGVWKGAKGGHTSGKGYINDCEKANEAALLGYCVLRVTKEHIYNGMAINWIKRALQL